MQTFPLFLKMAARRVLVIGGGEQAAAKVRLMLKSEGNVTVFAHRLDPELQTLVSVGRIAHREDVPGPGTFAAGDVVIIAREDHAGEVFAAAITDLDFAQMARSAGCLVNAVDQPELCDFYIPSIVDRDPVVVAIGTEGNAPLLARQIKTKIETMLEPRLGELAALAGRLRARVAEKIAPNARRAFWDWVFNGPPRQQHGKGAERDAARMIKQAIEAGGVESAAKSGFVSLVGAGVGGSDMITLRGVQRLQEADVIFYDRLVDPAVLELARRDAERVFVGKVPGAHAWPQERINGVIAAAAKRGMRVVRLKSGDPGIFGRAAEEIDCLDAAGIEWEIVPGVTAASAGAALIGKPLTERGETDTVVLTTGRKRDGANPVDWSSHLRRGTALAVYMGVEEADEIRDQLLREGQSSALPVEVMSCIGSPEQRFLRTTLVQFPELLRKENVRGPAIIVIRSPDSGASEQTAPVQQLNA